MDEEGMETDGTAVAEEQEASRPTSQPIEAKPTRARPLARKPRTKVAPGDIDFEDTTLPYRFGAEYELVLRLADQGPRLAGLPDEEADRR